MKYHSCRPLLWVCVPWILGIVINKYFNIPFVVFSFLAASFLLLALFNRQSRIATIFLLLAVLCAGSIYSKNHATVSPDHISKLSYGYRRDLILVEGIVISDAEPPAIF